MTPKPYDTTVAMIAGNILGHLAGHQQFDDAHVTVSTIDVDDVGVAVRLARAIVVEVQRTEASEPR